MLMEKHCKDLVSALGDDSTVYLASAFWDSTSVDLISAQGMKLVLTLSAHGNDFSVDPRQDHGGDRGRSMGLVPLSELLEKTLIHLDCWELEAIGRREYWQSREDPSACLPPPGRIPH